MTPGVSAGARRRGGAAPPPAGVGPYSRWRLLMTPGSSGFNSVATVEFRATYGGADQATGGTASASSTGFGCPPQNAFDGSWSSIWHSGTGDNAPWLRYDFPAGVTVAQVAITARPSENGVAPPAFDIEHSSDGTNWTKARSVTGQASWGDGETRLFSVP